ncbi:unnamed protein product [Paramecium primaurelia]|uniref:Uncharacterized protein n=1 Tax=Paramecium primaurelia TaxID=5886 RepID=A0A8S1PIC8_PARPR|nr:unnamed protein product [Paramecium primaurelia]
MDSEDYHFKFRIVILGTILMYVKVRNQLENQPFQMVNQIIKFKVLAITFGKIIEQEASDELNLKTVGYMDDDTLYKIAYWEIPGKHRSPDTFFRFCLGATAAIYMFDVSKRQTFEKIEHWITENEKTEIPVKVLIGNKIDLYASNKGGVSKSEAIGMARKYGMEYFEVCSIGDTSIAPVFDYLFSTIIGQIPNPPTPLSLMGKGILIGKRLLNSSKYQLALCDIASLYE